VAAESRVGLAEGGAIVTDGMPRTKRLLAGLQLLRDVGTSSAVIGELEVAAEVNAKSRGSSQVGFRNLLMVADDFFLRSCLTERPNGQSASDAAISQGRAKRERSVP
jgi:hypothetical protein